MAHMLSTVIPISIHPQMYIEIFLYARWNANLWRPRRESYIVTILEKLKIYVQTNEVNESAKGVIMKVYTEHSGDRNNEESSD